MIKPHVGSHYSEGWTRAWLDSLREQLEELYIERARIEVRIRRVRQELADLQKVTKPKRPRPVKTRK